MTNPKKQAELDRIREEREAWDMWSAFADATPDDDPDPIFPVMTRSEFYEELAKGTDEQRRSLFDALFNPALRQRRIPWPSSMLNILLSLPSELINKEPSVKTPSTSKTSS